MDACETYTLFAIKAILASAYVPISLSQMMTHSLPLPMHFLNIGHAELMLQSQPKSCSAFTNYTVIVLNADSGNPGFLEVCASDIQQSNGETLWDRLH